MQDLQCRVAPYPVPLGPVTVTIGGEPTQVLYAGAAPRMISGMLQVNAVVPSALASGRRRSF